MNKIKEARKQAGIKQTDLCARLGISQGALSGWENGKYEPGRNGWLKLSEILGVSIDYLMGNDVPLQAEGKKEAAAPECSSPQKEAIELINRLPDQSMDQALSYLRYLADREDKK